LSDIQNLSLLFLKASVICRTLGYHWGAIDYTKNGFFFDGVYPKNLLAPEGLDSEESHDSINYQMTTVHYCQEKYYHINQCELQSGNYVSNRDQIGGVICARNENETGMNVIF